MEFFLLFVLAFLFKQSATYGILMVAAFLNVVIYPLFSEYSVLVEAGLDTLVLVSLVVYGDKHRFYQIGLLLCALLLHVQFELDQANGTDLIFSNYGGVIIGITIMQLLGVFHGFSQRIWKGNHCWGVYSHSINLNRFKVWPKDS
jgi:hypothetical protein